MLCSIGSWNTLRRHDHIDLDPSLRIAPLDDDVPPFDVGGDLSSIRRRMSCRTTSGSIHRTSHIGIGVQSVFVPQRTRRMAYMTDLTDHIARLLLVTLEAAGLQTDLRALPSLRSRLDSWRVSVPSSVGWPSRATISSSHATTTGDGGLHDRHGALADDRDRHHVGADALARDAAGDVGGTEEGGVRRLGGRPPRHDLSESTLPLEQRGL